MSYEIKLPKIDAPTEREQIVQIRSYLFQLARQLQWVFENLFTTSNDSNYASSLGPVISIEAQIEELINRGFVVTTEFDKQLQAHGAISQSQLSEALSSSGFVTIDDVKSIVNEIINDGGGSGNTGDSTTEECEHEWIVTTNEATCTVAGYKISTCTRCGKTETETIDVLGHNYEGDGHQICSRCGSENWGDEENDNSYSEKNENESTTDYYIHCKNLYYDKSAGIFDDDGNAVCAVSFDSSSGLRFPIIINSAQPIYAVNIVFDSPCVVGCSVLDAEGNTIKLYQHPEVKLDEYILAFAVDPLQDYHLIKVYCKEYDSAVAESITIKTVS